MGTGKACRQAGLNSSTACVSVRKRDCVAVARARKGGAMPIIDGLLQELEQEAQTTRRVLERVPDHKLNWRPHPKARSLGELALHVATVPGGVAALVSSPSA